MKKLALQALNDLMLLISSKPVALTLITLTIYKLYSLTSATLAYSMLLVVLTGLLSYRIVITLLIREKHAIARFYQEQKKKNIQR